MVTTANRTTNFSIRSGELSGGCFFSYGSEDYLELRNGVKLHPKQPYTDALLAGSFNMLPGEKKALFPNHIFNCNRQPCPYSPGGGYVAERAGIYSLDATFQAEHIIVVRGFAPIKLILQVGPQEYHKTCKADSVIYRKMSCQFSKMVYMTAEEVAKFYIQTESDKLAAYITVSGSNGQIAYTTFTANLLS